MTPVFNFLILYKLRELKPSKQIKIIKRLNASRLLVIRRFKHLLKKYQKEKNKAEKAKIALEKREAKTVKNQVYLELKKVIKKSYQRYLNLKKQFIEPSKVQKIYKK